MDKQDLSVGMLGEGVASLHEKLLQNGADLPDSELQRKFFGPVARQAVDQWQTKLGLKTLGVVDATVRAAINKSSAANMLSEGALSGGTVKVALNATAAESRNDRTAA